MTTLTLADVQDLHPLARLAWEVADSAGRFLRDDRPDRLDVSSKSSPTDVVTQMDRGAEELIVSRLVAERPDDAILGEEGTNKPGTSGVAWIIDPLDGTVNYLFGFPTWGVSVGVEIDGVGEIGVIMTPEFHEGFVGVRGRGAWHIEGESAIRMSARACPSLDQALVTTGFGYSPERRESQARVLLDLIARIRDIRRTGCATVDLSWLSLGRTDAFYERGLNTWDYAAGLVIAREAGLDATVQRGSDSSGDLLICSVPSITRELTEILDDLGAGQGP